MKLYFMKQSALDYIKANITNLYKNYYQFDSPDWIYDLFDYDPFEVFDNVEDFELADTDQQPGEIDLQNCKTLYEKLKFISDSQASDERLWAGLTNKTFYSYMRKRWRYARRHLKKTADDSSAVLMRYFFKGTGRSGLFRNTLARCWWTGRLTYSEKFSNRWELLNALGSEDLVSKISDIFYSNTYSSNSDIVEGFCEGLKFYRDRNIHVSTREHIRPTAQYLNALGGGLLLDMFSADEIKKLVIERLSLLIKGIDPGVIAEINEDPDARFDSDEADADAEEVNIDFDEYLDSLVEPSELDIESILGKITTVEYGCKILVLKKPENKTWISNMPMADGDLNLLQQNFIGKSIGATWKQGPSTYEIIDIWR